MDDLYQNAWTSSITHNEDIADIVSSASWSAPKSSADIHDDGADLAAPSWSTGADIHWNEPSDSGGFSWSQTEPDLAWASSRYDAIQLSKPPDAASLTTEEEAEQKEEEEKDEDEVSTRAESAIEENERTEYLSPVPEPPSTSGATPPLPPASPDGFGTFESAITDASPTQAFVQDDIGADAWGSAWADTSESADRSTDDTADEWEAAKQQKAQQDRKVPPELLAAILTQCDEFLREYWPDPKDPTSESPDDAWRNDRRSGIEGVPNLESFMTSFLPPLTLQPPVQFGKTAVAKKMAACVRLTKNLPMTRSSPMSQYLAARDSSAWETAVKEKKEVVVDDVPIGWRILDKETSPTTAADSSKGKKTSRIFSFWGRRDSSVSRTSTASPTEPRYQGSVENAKSAPSGISPVASGRASQDSVRSTTRASVDKATTGVSVPIAPSPAPSIPVASSQVPPPTSISSYATAPDPVVERAQTPPAPSAVSRFLGRFSRGKSSPNTSRHNSLALSSDDLEFLSDIVPSASDESEDHPGIDLLSISNAMKPDALPVPPILPPPPPSAPLAQLQTSVANGTQWSAAAQLDGFDSFFGSLETASKPNSSPASSSFLAGPSIMQPSLLPTTLASSRPVTPAIASLANTSKRDSSPSPLSAFALPPPPSSRTHTPVPVASLSPTLPGRPPSVPIQEANLGSQPADKGTFATTFTILPPSSLQNPRMSGPSSPATSMHLPDSAASSPGSSRPLAELYPNAVPKASLAMSSKSASPFTLLPPPPSSRPYTPHSHSSLNVSIPVIAAPPSNVRPLSSGTAPPNLFDDDDDFSDFHASPASAQGVSPVGVTPSSAIPLSSAFALLPTPSQPSASSFANANAFLPDDDDFSDFHSSSSTTFQSANFPSNQSLLASTEKFPSDQSLLGSTTSTEKFLPTPRKPSGFTTPSASPSLRTPSPPRPPSKDPDGPGSLHSRRRSLANEHQHTLSLLSLAAKRPGRWPAPPSPLPQALAFPASLGGPRVNLMDEEGAEAEAEAPALLDPTPVAADTAAPAQFGGQMDLFAAPAKTGSAPSASATVAGSGLSAQDLSFFEGL